MTIAAFDHIAMPIAAVDAMLAFYDQLGFDVREMRPGQFYSAHFGDNKINFHCPPLWQSAEFTLRGPSALPGCSDLCFVWSGGEEALAQTLAKLGVKPLVGPVVREGGRGKDGNSTYIRDPDGNLLEFIVY